MSDQPYPPDEGRTHYDGCYIERGHHNCAITEIESLRAQLAVEQQAVGNLLAVIHRDGGHYQGEHGLAKACADAEAIVIADRAGNDTIAYVTGEG